MLSKPTPNLPINFSLENSDKISLLSFVLFLIIIPSVSFENFNIDYNIRRIRPLPHQNPNYYTKEEIRWLNTHVK